MSQSPQKAEFQDRLETYDIVTVVNKLQVERKLFTFSELKLKYADFYNDNQELFKKCYDNEMTVSEMDELVFMLGVRERIKRNEITFQEANNIISVYFAEHYQPELLSKTGFLGKN